MQQNFKEDDVLASNHIPAEEAALFSPMAQTSVPSEFRNHLKSQGEDAGTLQHRISMSMQQ